MNTTMRHHPHSQQEVTDRSRSRSAARTASENLLVSLDEAVLPPQITTSKNNTSTGTTLVHSARVMRREGGENNMGLLHDSSSPPQARQFDSSDTAAQGPSLTDKHATVVSSQQSSLSLY